MLVLGAAVPKADAADGITCKTFIKNARPQKRSASGWITADVA
jgi:hypothetical protein